MRCVRIAALVLACAGILLCSMALAETVGFGDLLDDLVAAVEEPSESALAKIDSDVAALDDPVAFAVADHWKRVYLDPEYRLYMLGEDDPRELPVTGRHAIVVLGFALVDGDMTDELRGRCDAAAAVAEAFPESIIVCSGGATGPNNPNKHTEAGRMKAYLISKHGIDPERICTDERAMTTAENALNTFKIFEQQGVETYTVVTSDYHQKWGQVLYNALAAKYRTEKGYGAELIGNYCFKIGTDSETFRKDYKIAAQQLRTVLKLPKETDGKTPGDR